MDAPRLGPAGDVDAIRGCLDRVARAAHPYPAAAAAYVRELARRVRRAGRERRRGADRRGPPRGRYEPERRAGPDRRVGERRRPS